MPGRNVNIMVDAYIKKKRRSCPTNWEAGKEAMSADRKVHRQQTKSITMSIAITISIKNIEYCYCNAF
jgi:hypothetical protein